MGIFEKGKELAEFLLLDEHQTLCQFVKAFFQSLSEANSSRTEYFVLEDQRALDTLAKLLVGNEKCSALAISDGQLLLATNHHIHVDHYVQMQRAFEILNASKQKKWFKFQFFETFEYFDSGVCKKRITKESKSVIFQLNQSSQRYELLGNHDINFKFTPEEHQIPDMPGSISLSVTTHQDKKRFLSGPCKASFNTKFAFFPVPMRLELNPLRRRYTKIIDNLSLIVRMELDSCRKSSDDDFIERNPGWMDILSDSLTYEMSTWPEYKASIDPYVVGEEGGPPTMMTQLRKFYSWLIQDYQRYKKEHGVKTSVSSVQAWAKEAAPQLTKADVPAPDFIKKKPQRFIERGFHYFEDLAQIEDFVRRDARSRGRLSQYLLKEDFFQRKDSVRVIDGVKDEHAEMRLLEEHLKSGHSLENYFGITMLCCAACHRMMQSFKLTQYRGFHSKLFGGWVFPEEIKRKYLNTFLGDDLFLLYQKLQDKICQIPGAASKVSQQEVALRIIEVMHLLNNTNVLKTLGIPEKYLIIGAKGDALYPSRTSDPTSGTSSFSSSSCSKSKV